MKTKSALPTATMAAMALLVAASGCGLEGPAPGEKKGVEGAAEATAPATAAPPTAAASYDNIKTTPRSKP